MPLFVVLILAALSVYVSVGEAADPELVFVDQGPSWTTSTRSDFYSRDQGSRLIPLDWLRAIRRADGQPFLVDGLARYGYLANPDSSDGLPVGFHSTGPAGAQTVGMTCSACHTRQIRVDGRLYRIDGGPALVDFQGFLAELDAAVGRVLASEAAFSEFAAAVFQNVAPPAADSAALRRDVDSWYLRYHAIMSKALPASVWGLGRLDAVGMIFNRVTGLDIGPPPTFLIPENIRVADAPARYPFIWNAPKQDRTQWPGFADNGSDTLGLARNVGQVIGVFAAFQPKRQGPIVNFLNGNSVNFDGLGKLEGLVKKIAPPKWPWAIDLILAAEGKRVFERPTANGGCADCHGIKPGQVRFPFNQTWATPVQNVGTDTRQYDILGWTAKSGVLKGVYIPLLTSELKEIDLSLNILATSVVGSIAENLLTFGGGGAAGSPVGMTASPPAPPGSPGVTPLPPALRDLNNAFRVPPAVMEAPEVRARLGLAPSPTAAAPPPKGAYEARVLHGIWAAAPYLHNGSVASLAELLKPSAQRKPQFAVGTDYDIQQVGLASAQSQSGYTRVTTDCADLNSGNSRCGHEFGTSLSDTEKKALLEYLKTY